MLGAIASARLLYSSLNVDTVNTSESVAKQREVIVAKQSLSPGDVLTRENLAIGKVPDDFFEASMLSPDRFLDVEGLVMTQTLAPGQALLGNHFAKSERRHPTLGLRRVQLILEDRYGFKQLPLPGDFVDFFWQLTHNQTLNPQATDAGSYLVEDVKLLSIKRATEPGIQHHPRRPEKGSWVHVEVEVSPEAALRLLKASLQGTLQMVLRNPDDRSLGTPWLRQEPQKPSAANSRSPVSSIQRPAAAPEGGRASQLDPGKSKEQTGQTNRVEVIRGGQRSIEQSPMTVANPSDRNTSGRDIDRVSVHSDRPIPGRDLMEHLRRLSEPGSTQTGVIE
jgi:Flp pilus assembly protein CpaB